MPDSGCQASWLRFSSSFSGSPEKSTSRGGALISSHHWQDVGTDWTSR
ncbi:hypothetical protein LEMLEM_LOCUS6366, partial [Lemmus lemmus]